MTENANGYTSAVVTNAAMKVMAFFLLLVLCGCGGQASNTANELPPGDSPAIPNSASNPAIGVISNSSPLDSGRLADLIAANNAQAKDIATSWHNYYQIVTQGSGQPIEIVPGPIAADGYASVYGYHDGTKVVVSYVACIQYAANGTIDLDATASVVSNVVSREWVEEVVGQPIMAPCDGLPYTSGNTRGGWVSDFVLPSWCTSGAAGFSVPNWYTGGNVAPYDWAGQIKGPGLNLHGVPTSGDNG